MCSVDTITCEHFEFLPYEVPLLCNALFGRSDTLLLVYAQADLLQANVLTEFVYYPLFQRA